MINDLLSNKPRAMRKETAEPVTDDDWFRVFKHPAFTPDQRKFLRELRSYGEGGLPVYIITPEVDGSFVDRISTKLGRFQKTNDLGLVSKPRGGVWKYRTIYLVHMRPKTKKE